MEKYQYLLDKLSINDFILRGEYGETVLDLVDAYAVQANAAQGGLEEAKSKLQTESGVDLKTLKKLLDLPEGDLEKLITGSSKFADSIPEEDLPDSYKEGKAKLEEARKSLGSNKLSEEAKKELEGIILEGEKNLAELKKELINKQFQDNPNLLANNPKVLKMMLDILDTEVPEYQPSQKSENLRQIRKGIETNFLIMKGWDEGEIAKIVKGTHECSLSKKEFIDLLNAIVENDDLLNQKTPLFTNTLS